MIAFYPGSVKHKDNSIDQWSNVFTFLSRPLNKIKFNLMTSIIIIIGIAKIGKVLNVIGILLANGKWATWGTWSECDVPCGTGHRHRTRTCTNPQPDLGGDECVKENRESGLVEKVTEVCDTGNKCKCKSISTG